MNSTSTLARRSFVRLSMLALGAALVPGNAFARMALGRGSSRRLSLYNIHTGEASRVEYWRGGNYVPEALPEIYHILRDFRANEVKRIDLRLLDLLYALKESLGTSAPFHVISGYRSPTTNAMLRARSERVAAHSLHIDGKAVDIRVPGRTLREIREAALALRGGGVGYYARSDFVHLDVGRVRCW